MFYGHNRILHLQNLIKSLGTSIFFLDIQDTFVTQCTRRTNWWVAEISPSRFGPFSEKGKQRILFCQTNPNGVFHRKRGFWHFHAE
jgi:hypothetical protein